MHLSKELQTQVGELGLLFLYQRNITLKTKAFKGHFSTLELFL